MLCAIPFQGPTLQGVYSNSSKERYPMDESIVKRMPFILHARACQKKGFSFSLEWIHPK